jgi:DNA-binding Xre family transcriptional regulator
MGQYIRTNLAYLRTTRGKLSQREISQATGIGQKTLSALETGATNGIDFNTLIKLCNFFRCTPSDILVIEDEPEILPPPKPESLKKAEELIARGLKAAMEAAPQTPAEIWAEFDAVRERMQAEAAKNSARVSRKRGSDNA